MSILKRTLGKSSHHYLGAITGGKLKVVAARYETVSRKVSLLV